MSALVDTNVLLRRAQPDHRENVTAVQSGATLLARNVPLYYTAQNLIEFWGVATRPAGSNGLGLPASTVLEEFAALEDLLTFLPDSPAILGEWKSLVCEYSVAGAKVHDARFAAVARVYGIRSILTFNTSDFLRFRHLTVLHPAEIYR